MTHGQNILCRKQVEMGSHFQHRGHTVHNVRFAQPLSDPGDAHPGSINVRPRESTIN
jgi:hypothetical protein